MRDLWGQQAACCPGSIGLDPGTVFMRFLPLPPHRAPISHHFGKPFAKTHPLHCHVYMFKIFDMKADLPLAIPSVWQDVSKVFVALGDPQRQRLLLAFEPGERLNVTQLAEASTLSRPTVSHHLKILREAGVLATAKAGKEVFYWIDKPFLQDSLQRVLTYIEEAT